MTVAEAWQQLVEAMEVHEPACIDIPLFTQDDLSNADVKACAEVCKPCPLFIECKRYADIARPAAGVWAGRKRNGRPGKENQ
jgi:hypothetical protein